jgi:alpha-L-rhamnosidase
MLPQYSFKPEICWLCPAILTDKKNQYIEFRQTFDLDEVSGDSELRISADSNFTAWINGKFVGTGQFSDYPEEKTYSTMNVSKFLQIGSNVLAVQIIYWGIDHFTYIKGKGGLIYEIHTPKKTIASGSDTVFRISTSYKSGDMARISPQMPFVFQYSGQEDDGWTMSAYNHKNWRRPEKEDIITTHQNNLPILRPLPMLEIKPRATGKIIAQGFFDRCDSEDESVAELMQSDYLSARRFHEVFSKNDQPENSFFSAATISSDIISKNGCYFIVDLGREEVGFIDLELDAAKGTIIDIAIGEHLSDLRVRSSVGGRNFASRYICTQGRQKFTHYGNRYAGRYIQLHINPSSQDITICYAGIIPTEYPLEMKGEFCANDSLMNKIHEVSLRTLHLCMHEHYEDCPWREQALYANDSRNQALAGYYGFGEYEFPKVSFALLGRGLKEDGFLELCAPAEIEITIPSFTMVWILAIRDAWLFSGNIDFTRTWQPQIKKMLDAFIAKLKNGLFPCPQGKRFWQFYDWADGLDSWDEKKYLIMEIEGERFDAILNLYLILALKAGAQIAKACNNDETAKKYSQLTKTIAESIHRVFWNDTDKLYQTYSGHGAIENHYAELTQSLALLAGVCPQTESTELRKKIACKNNGLVETTLSQSLYKFEALLQSPAEHGKWVFDKMAENWGYMLFNGATSFWETLKGQADFGDAGSLCHGWAAIPVYFYQAYLLGVKPVEPGFKKFMIFPLFSVLNKASGKVPTPYGDIGVDWERQGEKTILKLVYPKGTEPVNCQPSEDDNWQISCR